MPTSPLAAAPAPPPARVRLDYLDGMRALAAMYVCLSHAMITVVWPVYPDLLTGEFPGLPALTIWTIKLLRGGHFAVTIFIVLSGYCLMLPVARQGSRGRLQGGVGAFLRRRARRVLPPYYAALALSVLLTVVIPGMRHPTGFWSQALPIWRGGRPLWEQNVIISHLLLVQNWSWAWYFKIDPPAWSMATEGQIYLIFAFVLLPLSRRLGVAGVAVLAFWLHAEVHWYFNENAGDNFNTSYDYVYWTYVGLFCLGMLGASVGFSPAPWAKFCRERLPWGVFAAFAWALLFRVYLPLGQPWMQTHLWLTDPMIGAATVLLIIFCTQALAASAPGGPLPLVVRVLQAGPLVKLGGFSYSLYLVHFPLIIALSLLLLPLGMSLVTACWVMLALSIPVTVAGSYGFHLVFERPFMPGQPATARDAARAAVVSPAP